MRLAQFSGFLVVVVILFVSTTNVLAQNEGLPDLDRATDLQLRARSLEDLKRVIDLCDRALQKGLDEDNTQFAKQLLASSLYQRAKSFGAIIEAGQMPERTPQLRRAALADLEKALENYPELADAHLLAAKLQAAAGGDAKKALAAATEAIRLFKDNKEQRSKAFVLRAQLTKDPAKKLADYDEAIRLDPSNMSAWLERATYHLDQGNHEKAARQFAELLEQDETNVMALHGAAEALIQLERYDDALKHLDKAIQLRPRVALGYTTRARVRLLTDKAKQALADLDRALELEPTSLSTLLLRARVLAATGETKRALADVDQMLTLRPNLPQALMFRSMISAAEGKYSEAIADIQILIREEPDNADWRLQLAAYYAADRRPGRAINEYSKVIDKNPDNWQALRGRADALLSLGKQAEAIQDYERAVKLRPEDSSILNNLAWVLATSPNADLRNAKRSIELATKACEVTNYERPHILSTLAAGYAESGDFETAIKWSSKAVELGKDDLKDQLDQLRQELESYKQKKPWRELQQLDGASVP
jgi:tetratricopeptide (TPR) repeat protein